VIPVGGTVQFTDASTGDITGWSWTFGDGETSTAQSPQHTYATAGTYTVTLTVSNAYGGDTEAKTGYIDVGPIPAAAFTASPTAGLAPLTVQFTDLSLGNPTSWHWDFGDGGTSTDQSPAHTYTEPGTYTVTLTVTNAYGEDTETKTVYIYAAPPIASFTANVTRGNAPLTVQFTDTSTGDITGWSWDFGDGNTSTDQNPTHTYTEPGTYTASLTVSGPTGEDSEIRSIFARAMRPKASSPIATLDESPYTSFVGAFGGSNQLNETTEGVDWLGIKDAAERPYTDLIGPLFYVIVFAIPFLMQWLRQGSMAVPAAIGIILGGIMLAKTSAEYHLAAIAFIALSILAVVWGVIKDRM
jgi:PKD repeat protein